MNATVVILIVVIVLLAIALCVAGVFLIIYKEDYDRTEKPRPTCTEGTNPNYLLQLDSSYDCEVNGETGTYYYLGATGGYYVVSTTPLSSEDVCNKFCTSFAADGTCIGPTFDGSTANDNYRLCLDELNPSDCIPPVAMAAKGSILYYPFAPTPAICENTTS